MKRLSIYVIALCSLAIASLRACPTCIGRLDHNAPPLFSKEYEEYYRLHDSGTIDDDNGDDSDERGENYEKE